MALRILEMPAAQSTIITFYYLKSGFYFPRRTFTKKFIQKILKKEKARVSRVSIIFCSDKYLLDVNRKYLKHNYSTDIITFNLEDDGQPGLGEIYISIDRVL